MVSSAGFGKRFFDTTRGQVVARLRRGACTVEELARALALTDNAIRSHLTTLERDGLVRQEGVRRGAGAGKPALLYELHPDAEPLLSSAYPPVLGVVLDVLVDELPEPRVEAMLHEVGRRLARAAGAPASGTPAERVRAAADALAALGGDVEVEPSADGFVIRGCGCPLSATVSRRPEACRAVAALVAEIAGAPTRTLCEHGDRPRCRFAVTRLRPP